MVALSNPLMSSAQLASPRCSDKSVTTRVHSWATSCLDSCTLFSFLSSSSLICPICAYLSRNVKTVRNIFLFEFNGKKSTRISHWSRRYKCNEVTLTHIVICNERLIFHIRETTRVLKSRLVGPTNWENHPSVFAGRTETLDNARRQAQARPLSRAGNNRKINRFNFRDMINHN